MQSLTLLGMACWWWKMPPTQIPQALESLPEIPKAQQVTGDFFETREFIVCSKYKPVYSVCKKNATIALTREKNASYGDHRLPQGGVRGALLRSAASPTPSWSN